ncbi:MAG TPA: NAD-dependent epimerase/dehydratase family protein [Candidatus Limnocylindrales bacterium]|nr:NAD-dependent epimerase/dehydratase family protein [Candidatus Limnocylindrales bacterium]
MQAIVGAGPIGSRVARLLAGQGEKVRVITRSGRGPKADGIELVAADASDAATLTSLTAGATTLYNCANPAYHRWLTDWPPLANAMLQAAKANSSVLVAVNNLYGYGPVDRPMTEQTPMAATHPKLRVRARMWEDMLASGVPVTEARASDYIGVGANSVLEEVVLKRTLRNQTAYAYGDKQAPHSWSNVDDTARALVTIAQDERAWGKAWHVPTAPAMSIQAIAERANEIAGLPKPKIVTMPYAALWTVGLFSTTIRELRATYYQFARPFILDSSLTERTFGLTPTPIDDSLAEIVGAYRDR